MIELIILQFHALQNNAEQISLRSGPGSPHVCLLFRKARLMQVNIPVLGVVFFHCIYIRRKIKRDVGKHRQLLEGKLLLITETY